MKIYIVLVEKKNHKAFHFKHDAQLCCIKLIKKQLKNNFEDRDLKLKQLILDTIKSDADKGIGLYNQAAFGSICEYIYYEEITLK